MNDLIKRIDEEVESWEHCAKSELLRDCRAEIQRLTHNNEVLTVLCQDYAAEIKALEANGEPVCYITQPALESLTSGKVSGVRVWRNPDEPNGDTALYTTPPSVDALIAEIDAMMIPDNFTYQTLIHKSHIEKILNKYRSAK